jgi:hypothetical protein
VRLISHTLQFGNACSLGLDQRFRAAKARDAVQLRSWLDAVVGHWRCARLIRVFGDVGSGPLECACDGGSRDGGGRSISPMILAWPLSSGRESRKLAVRTGHLFVKGEMYRFTRFPLYFPGGVLFALRDPGPKNVEKPNAISAKGESCIRVLSVSVCLLPCLLMLRQQSAFAWRNSFFPGF